MTNWITVNYADHGVASLADYTAWLNERPMRIDDDSKPIARKKVGDYMLKALDSLRTRLEGAERIGHSDPRRKEGMRIAFTASRDIKAEGVTRAQAEMVKFIAENPALIAAVATHPGDDTERYMYAMDLILDVLADLGLARA